MLLRTCARCTTRLSAYNPSELCHPCQGPTPQFVISNGPLSGMPASPTDTELGLWAQAMEDNEPVRGLR